MIVPSFVSVVFSESPPCPKKFLQSRVSFYYIFLLSEPFKMVTFPPLIKKNDEFQKSTFQKPLKNRRIYSKIYMFHSLCADPFNSQFDVSCMPFFHFLARILVPFVKQTWCYRTNSETCVLFPRTRLDNDELQKAMHLRLTPVRRRAIGKADIKPVNAFALQACSRLWRTNPRNGLRPVDVRLTRTPVRPWRNRARHISRTP